MSGIFFEQDTPEQRRQLTELERRGYPVRRMTQYHVKIGEVNYYVTTGTITIDPAVRHKMKGFHALLALLDEKYPDPTLLSLQLW
ncbi:hypothetical protein [Bradyrhizobium sp. AUGA SZCCT0160]|uniref:hypothetical protein n=1 Tax=Bradyrhizobium sp. AUGA SZCCT0160 TaxID=2807662 RepID=UPI001BA4E9DF|nr:hypothetical protein [Bradyrhizobium sp. AUGA SZCCT0160]MBR1191468.1 hypothetical protein [Bradyrhizobium sp. AUGA SZCCT0160]